MEIFDSFQSSSPETPNTQNSDRSDYSQDARQNYHCTFSNCGKVFKFKSEIARHSLVHFNDRPYTCPYDHCQKSFKRADALDAHLQIHADELPFMCNLPDCSEKFATKASLKYHLLKHKNECAFKCSFSGCEKAFFTKGQLKQHEKASKYHKNLAKRIRRNKEQATAAKSSLYQNDCLKQFCTEVVRSSELKNKDKTAIKVYFNQEDERESFENIVKYVLKENAIIKRQDSFLEEDSSDFLSSGSQLSVPRKDFNNLFDESELKIIDFLKERQSDNNQMNYTIIS